MGGLLLCHIELPIYYYRIYRVCFKQISGDYPAAPIRHIQHALTMGTAPMRLAKSLQTNCRKELLVAVCCVSNSSAAGIEPATYHLKGGYSTSELRANAKNYSTKNISFLQYWV